MIDTDSYAGNFEREMGSYVSGECDEWGEHRGKFYAKLYKLDHPSDPMKKYRDYRVCDPGDDGIIRSPVYSCDSPDGEHNSVEIFLSKKPPKKLLEMLVTRARAFSLVPTDGRPFGNQRPKVLRCRLVATCVVSGDLQEWKFDE